MIVHTSADGGGAGHVALVDYVSGNTVYAAEQNVNNSADIGMYIWSSGVLSRTGWHIYGVVHDPDNHNTGSTGKSLLQVENAGSGWAVYNLTASANKQIVGAPSVLWSQQPQAFGVGTDGTLIQFTLCPGGGSWCAYTLLQSGAMSGGVRAVMHGSAIEVFGPSADGSLLQVENAGGGWAAYNLSAGNNVKIANTPGVIWGSGSPTVYAVDTAGNLRDFSIGPGGWQVGVIATPQTLYGGVAAIQVGAAIELFARGTNGHLIQIEGSNGTWTSYDVAPTLLTSGSPGVIWGPAGPNVFVADPWGSLRQLTVSNGSWRVDQVLPNGAVSAGVDAIQLGSTIEILAASA